MNEARILHLDFKKISQDGKTPKQQNSRAKVTPSMFFQLDTRFKTVYFVLLSLFHILLTKTPVTHYSNFNIFHPTKKRVTF